MSFVLQGTQVYIFLTRAGYTLVQDYPKQLEKEFGSPQGVSLHSVDAAFTCPGSSRLHITAGEGRRVLRGGWFCASPSGRHKGQVQIPVTWKPCYIRCLFPGQKLWWVDLHLGAPATWTELPWPHTKVDGALCTEKSLGPHSCSANGLGLYLVQGPNLYCYKDVEELSKTKNLPQAQRMNSLLGCTPRQHS